MRHPLRFFVLSLLLPLCSSLPAQADEPNEFGAGIVLGEPSGVNMQFYWDNNQAIDLTAAWSFSDWLTVAGDFQIYNYLLDAPREWRWFYGIGSYMTFPEDDDLTWGVRIPFGVKYHFPYSIVDVWAEAAPGLELLEDTEAIFQGGIGVTFWLK
jgi:hypothetical protein